MNEWNRLRGAAPFAPIENGVGRGQGIGPLDRSMALVFLSLVLAPPPPAFAQVGAPAIESRDDAAVRSLWSTLDSLWNARDADRFSRLFTEDASFRFVDRGQSLETRPRILEHFKKQFSTQAAELRHRTGVRGSRSVSPNAVAVDGEVEVLRTGSAESMPSTVLVRFAIFAIMKKSADGWQIQLLRAFQLPSATSKGNGD